MSSLTLCIVIWKHGFFCVALCVCCSHPTSGPTPWLECVYALVHVCMCIQLPISPQTPLHSYMETWVPLCGTVFVSQSPHNCSHTLDTMFICISTCIHVHMTTHVCSTHLHSFMQTWVALYVCFSQPTSRPTTSLACVHASVYVLISTWLPMSAHPLFSYIEAWIPLCSTVCVFQSPHFRSNTLVKECVHASVHVLLSCWVLNSAPSPLYSYMERWVPLCGTVCVCLSPISGPIPW